MAKNRMYRTERFRGPLMRISYAWQLFTPREAGENSRGGYGCTLIMPKKDDWSSIQAKIKECVTNQWGDRGAEKWKQGLIKNPIIDGAGKEARNKETGDLHPGMGEDVQFIRVASGADRRPQVYDQNVVLLTDADDCPSGSWGYPVLNAYCWHNDQNGDGVSFGIEMFQLVKKAEGDEILGGGGRAKPEDFFEAVAGATGDKPESAGDFFG
ncbi:ssDNA-binding protein [Thauera sp.]|uniref:ssDNA-binding protein n=1 Tax=Thauera sp. TaxID=1905334 RepID=UPI002B66655C|nr:ssDNA-binding protein [Thauera sp.]HRP25381.1 DUF2815 family protein [Thauera sp.]